MSGILAREGGILFIKTGVHVCVPGCTFVCAEALKVGVSPFNHVWPVVIDSELGQVHLCLPEHPRALLGALVKDTRNKGRGGTPLNALAIA